jgi:putative nucleotidyltransferase with HDIG domain
MNALFSEIPPFQNKVKNFGSPISRHLFEPSKKIIDSTKRQKARLLSVFLFSLFFIFLLINLAYILTVPGYKFPVADLIGYAFLLITYIFSRTRFTGVAIFLMLIMFPMNVFQNVFSGTSIKLVATLSYLLPSYILASIFLTIIQTAIYGYGISLFIFLLPIIVPGIVRDYSQILGFLSVSMVVITLCIIWTIFRNQIEHDHQQELRDSYDNTLEGWSRALEIRDKETQGHSIRVTALTMQMGNLLGMSEIEQENLYRGALLHDIGKMAIPDSILTKNSSLNEDERKLIQTHPKIAEEMLSKIAFLTPALVIPSYHHEWWNGTGYPYGLKGEKIPLAARIFAIVDVWDALLSDRPYRKAWPKEKAIQYLKDQSGIQFDPKIVELFLKVVSTN